MALGYGTRESEPGSPAPVFTPPANVRTPPVEGDSSDRSERRSRRDRKGKEKKEGGKKGKKKSTYYQTEEQSKKWNPYDTSANVVIVTKEVQDQMIAEKRAKALSLAGLSETVESEPEVVAVVDDLHELEDLSDLPDYDSGDEQEQGINSPKDLAVAAGTAAVTGTAVGYGLVKTGLWGTAQTATGYAAGAYLGWKSLPLVDWFGRKLDAWGDSLLKKADLSFPFGPLAEATAGIMNWTTGKILSKESLADLLKKEKEEKQKALDKALKQLLDDQTKMEKKKDDAAKKEKAKKEKEEKRIQDLVAKGIDEELAKVLAEGAEPDEAEEKEEPKAE